MHILVVEDEKKVASFIKRGLEAASYSVDVEHDGEAGLKRLLKSDYDLVILDVMLPLKDGFEVCRELRAEGLTFPILMLTARDAPPDRVAGLDMGADDYLTKPFDFHELLARLRALLRRGPALRPETVEIADLSIDMRARRVRRGGRHIELTAKEYGLLEYMARRAGEVVTRAEIAEHVWEENFDPFSNLIEVYVQRLRRKIDEGHAPKLLRTRRGEGYVLAPAKEDSDA
jgi:two-component system copper resistance phosphate regulon response regulator CusR